MRDNSLLGRDDSRRHNLWDGCVRLLVVVVAAAAASALKGHINACCWRELSKPVFLWRKLQVHDLSNLLETDTSATWRRCSSSPLPARCSLAVSTRAEPDRFDSSPKPLDAAAAAAAPVAAAAASPSAPPSRDACSDCVTSPVVT